MVIKLLLLPLKQQQEKPSHSSSLQEGKVSQLILYMHNDAMLFQMRRAPSLCWVQGNLKCLLFKQC
jgi:hypothetical protein